MNERSITRLYKSMRLMQIIGALGYLFSFLMQENFYGEKNILFSIYNLLGPLQLSMTSLFTTLNITGLGLIGLHTVLKHFNLLRMKYSSLMFYGTCLAGALVYTHYEIYQSAFPKYPDNFFADALLSWFACLVLMLSIRFSMKHRP